MRYALVLLLASFLVVSVSAEPITYQGQLRQGGQPTTSTPGMIFRLYDSLLEGSQVGPDVAYSGVQVSDGLFQVELDFGPSAFDGSARYLEIEVAGATLSPRQAVTATPQALIATTTVAGAIGTSQINAAQVQQRVTGSCPTGQYIRVVNQNGTVLCEAEVPSWRLGGNAGTSSAADFIGTTDNQALELRTANVRSLRIEPSAELVWGLPITANVIAGSRANEVTPGVRGATIAGGGVPEGPSDPDHSWEAPNRVTDNYGTVGGGYGNQAGDGEGTTSDTTFATVGGGLGNTAGRSYSTVGGGWENTAFGFASTIGGGVVNISSGSRSTVAGGYSNTASEQYSTAGGGQNNTASGEGSIVAGGQLNTASGNLSAIGGGSRNCAGGRYSWAGGRRAKVRPATDPGAGSCSGLTYPGGNGDEGSFVWADSTFANFISQRPNQFRVRANGGVDFQTGIYGLVAFSNSSDSGGAAIQGESVHPDGIAITGRNESTDATLVLNNRGTGRLIRAFSGGAILMNLENNGNLWIAGALTQNSDRDQKEAFETVDVDKVLDQLAELDISSWRYLRSDNDVRHIGPMAQDFHAAFGFGVSETTISTVDAQGIAFAAIQALNQRLLESNAELERRLMVMEERERENDGLRDRLAAIEALLLDDAGALVGTGRQ